MIQKIHQLLTSIPLTKGLQRKLVHGIKNQIGAPDAFFDLAKLIRTQQPAAVLDVGCHLGKTISRILEQNQVQIHGFEPTSSVFEKVSSSFDNNSLVAIHNVALSNATGTATFHNNNNEQTNSLLDNDVGNESLGDITKHVGVETINTIRLDEWVTEHLPVGNLIIKSDIQGAEGLMLEGGQQTFRNRVLGFYSEAQIAPMYEGQADFFKLQKMLTELGFFLHNIYPCYHDQHGRALQTDAFWINESVIQDGKSSGWNK